MYSKTLNEVGFGTSWKSTTAITAEVVFGVTAIPCTSTKVTLKLTVVPPLSLALAVPIPVSFLIFTSIFKFKLVIFVNEPATDVADVLYLTLWKPTPNLCAALVSDSVPLLNVPPEPPEARSSLCDWFTVPDPWFANSAKLETLDEAKFAP